MKKNITKTMLCILITISLGLNSLGQSLKEVKAAEISHVSDEIFDGYKGIETTISGKVGYNYALNVPDGKNAILFGFTPYNQIFYKIAEGWALKLPYLSIGKKNYYQNVNGYTYSIDNNSEQYNIIDFPSKHLLKSNTDGSGYILEKAYGVKEYFSQEGFLTKSIDEFGNTVEYVYNNGFISKIVYSDGSLIVFQKSDDAHSIHINYSKDGVINTIACFDF